MCVVCVMCCVDVLFYLVVSFCGACFVCVRVFCCLCCCVIVVCLLCVCLCVCVCFVLV